MVERKYGVFGPFDIPRCDSGKVADAEARQYMWGQVEKKDPELPHANGCYIFSIGARKEATPWYVGQTNNGFRNECFAPHKLDLYNEILPRCKEETRFLLLLARETPTGRFQQNLAKSEAASLEYLLISHCLRANQELLNTSKTAFLREAEIPGLLNSPQRKSSRSAKFLSRLLNSG